MSNLEKLATHDDDGNVRVVVEVPRGSRAKLKYEPELGAIVFSRPLVLGVAYPYDWGFVPSTLAPDGDPLDAMVVHDACTYPGVVIACTLVGVVKVSQKREKGGGREANDRLIALPAKEPREEGGFALTKRQKNELEQFFVSAVLFEGKAVRIEGWGDRKEAERLVKQCARVYEAGEKKK